MHWSDLRRADPLQLRALELTETYTSDDALTALVRQASRLESIDVCGCADISDDFVVCAAAHCRDLCSLKVGDVVVCAAASSSKPHALVA